MQTQRWPLWMGLLLAMAFVIIAAIGPLIAPQDPTRYNYVLNVGGQYLRPPFPIFASSEFPLGSDQFGRDVLSQLLWAVRPTLLLVLSITAVRLLLGLLMGVLAGWWPSLFSQNALRLASVFPVLLVALFVLAAFSQSLGGAAFFVGLALTGWSDSARIVCEQTALIRQQAFIEAAYASGLGTRGVWLRHVVRQLTPTLQILMPLEVSAVLLLLATLAVLGYFVGGDNWIMVGDFTAARTSGAPELGQMLALAVQQRSTNGGLVQMLITGGVVAVFSAGLNLLSEGLREESQRAMQRRQRAATLGDLIETRLIEQERQHKANPRIVKQRRNLAVMGGIVFVGLIVAASLLWPRAQPLPAVPVPGGQVWANTRRDALGSLRAPAHLPVQANVLSQIDLRQHMQGGPALSKEGQIYVLADHALIRLNTDLQVQWKLPLTQATIGGPAIDAQGNLYFVDGAGGLSLATPDGQLRWHVAPQPAAAALDGPVVGEDGVIYYPVEGYVIAVNPDGTLKWRGETTYSYFAPNIRVTPTYVFFQDIALSAATGKKVLKESPNMLDQFVAGSDGQLYLQSDKGLLQWIENENSVGLAQTATWDYTRYFPGAGAFQAGLTSDSTAWLLFANAFQDGRIAWMDLEGKMLASFNFPLRDARVMAIGEDDTLLICGARPNRGASCLAAAPRAAPRAGQLVWQLELPVNTVAPVGAALVDGKMLLLTAAGQLVWVGAP